MEQKSIERLLYWGRPAATVLLGVTLLLNPRSFTELIASIFGFAAAAIGAALLISYFFGKNGGFTRLCAGIIILCVGFSVIRNPLNLAARLGQLIGILLIVNCIRELTSVFPLRGRKLSVLLGIAGMVLLFVPLSASVIATVILGIIVLGLGCSMFAARLFERKHPAKDAIIDSL